jgi:hypothetical protein
MHHPDPTGPEHHSGPVARPQRRVAVAAAVLAAALAALWGYEHHAHETAAPAATPTPVQQQQQMGAAGSGEHQPGAMRLADFGSERPSADAKLMANWIVATRDNANHAFILVDKKDAHVYVFHPDGHLASSAPVLLGQAHGDAIVPGTENLPLTKITPDEKITPAGRFVADIGRNADQEDVIWVDYDAGISMHRVRPQVAAERRLERLATPTTDDNRISFGCINLPVTFYEDVAKPSVQKYGAVIYVLPEQKTVQQVFGAYDVTDPAQLAAARERATLAAASGSH